MADWKLNRERLDQIIFAMENQEETFILDIETGELHSGEEQATPAPSGRYHRLPLWRSLEGFQLMEKFVSGLRNPIFREELREALAAGRGVFRNFKDVLKRNLELARIWYSFKEKEMTRIVMDWLNEIREIEGLERLDPPEDGTEELIASDFSITESFAGHLDSIRNCDLQAFYDAFPAVEKERVEQHVRELRSGLPDPTDPLSTVLVVETPAGDFAGFIWAYERESPLEDGPVVEMIQMVVLEEFQGLGLGEVLLKRLIHRADVDGAAKLRIHLSGRFLDAAKLFAKAGFEHSAHTMELDLSRWEEE